MAARQAARRCRPRQAEKDAGAQVEGRERKGKDGGEEEEEEELELKEVEASEGELVKIADSSL